MAEIANRAAAVFFNFLIFLNWYKKKRACPFWPIGSIEHLAQMKATLSVPQGLTHEEAEGETLVTWHVSPRLPPIILKNKITLHL